MLRQQHVIVTLPGAVVFIIAGPTLGMQRHNNAHNTIRIYYELLESSCKLLYDLLDLIALLLQRTQAFVTTAWFLPAPLLSITIIKIIYVQSKMYKHIILKVTAV